MMYREILLRMLVELLKGLHPQNFEGKKHPKFGAISNNFRFRSRLSLERIKISTIGKPSTTTPPTFNE